MKITQFSIVLIFTITFSCAHQKQSLKKKELIGLWFPLSFSHEVDLLYNLKPISDDSGFKYLANDLLVSSDTVEFYLVEDLYPIEACFGTYNNMCIGLLKKKSAIFFYTFSASNGSIVSEQNNYSSWKIESKGRDCFLVISEPFWPKDGFSRITFKIISFESIHPINAPNCELDPNITRKLVLEYVDSEYQ